MRDRSKPQNHSEMTDTFSTRERSQIMARVKGKDTTPELVIRKIIHSLGYRYRLHSSSLPGKPDIVFPSRQKIIFVNGCFWHGHKCKRGKRTPKSNREYWVDKIKRNVDRDKKHIRRLRLLGWMCLVIWECQMKDKDKLTKRIIAFLEKR